MKYPWLRWEYSAAYLYCNKYTEQLYPSIEWDRATLYTYEINLYGTCYLALYYKCIKCRISIDRIFSYNSAFDARSYLSWAVNKLVNRIFRNNSFATFWEFKKMHFEV